MCNTVDIVAYNCSLNYFCIVDGLRTCGFGSRLIEDSYQIHVSLLEFRCVACSLK